MTTRNTTLVIVSWDDQVADGFTLHAFADGIRFVHAQSIVGYSYKVSDLPPALKYVFQVRAYFDLRSGELSYVTYTSKLDVYP